MSRLVMIVVSRLSCRNMWVVRNDGLKAMWSARSVGRQQNSRTSFIFMRVCQISWASVGDRMLLRLRGHASEMRNGMLTGMGSVTCREGSVVEGFGFMVSSCEMGLESSLPHVMTSMRS